MNICLLLNMVIAGTIHTFRLSRLPEPALERLFGVASDRSDLRTPRHASQRHYCAKVARTAGHTFVLDSYRNPMSSTPHVKCLSISGFWIPRGELDGKGPHRGHRIPASSLPLSSLTLASGFQRHRGMTPKSGNATEFPLWRRAVSSIPLLWIPLIPGGWAGGGARVGDKFCGPFKDITGIIHKFTYLDIYIYIYTVHKYAVQCGMNCKATRRSAGGEAKKCRRRGRRRRSTGCQEAQEEAHEARRRSEAKKRRRRGEEAQEARRASGVPVPFHHAVPVTRSPCYEVSVILQTACICMRQYICKMYMYASVIVYVCVSISARCICMRQ